MLQVRKTNPFDPPLKPKENDPPSLWRLMRDLVYTIDKVGETEARYEASRGLAEQTYSGPTFGDWEKKQLPDDPFHSYTARLNTLDDFLAVGQPQLLEDKKALKYDEDHSRFEDMKDRLVEIVNESMVKIPAHVWEPQLSFKKAEADRELSIIDAIKELAKALNDWDPTTRPEQKSDFGTLLRWIFDGLDNFKPRRNRQEAFNVIKKGLQEMAEKLNRWSIEFHKKLRNPIETYPILRDSFTRVDLFFFDYVTTFKDICDNLQAIYFKVEDTHKIWDLGSYN